MNYTDIQLINNEAIHQFELFVDGQRSFIDYKIKGDKIFLIHTEVPEALQGQGIAEVLVEKAFNYIEEQNMEVVPLCAYVQVFLKRHPEWDRLIAV
jgi:predicted GNAT family acetyltransferase